MLYHHMHRAPSGRAKAARSSAAANAPRPSAAGAAAAAQHIGSDDSEDEVVELSDSDDTSSDVDPVGGHHVTPMGPAAAASTSDGEPLAFGGTLDIDEYHSDNPPPPAIPQ